MQYIIDQKDQIEILSGSALLLLSTVRLGINLKRNLTAFRNYKHFTIIKSIKSINYQRFIKNPSLSEYVIIPKLALKATPELFSTHMKMVDSYITEANLSHSYSESCKSFDGEVSQGSQQYSIRVDCQGIDPFVSSSLLCNTQNILKNNLKEKVTMFVYGKLGFSKQQRRLMVKGECFTTNREEIQRTWNFILGIMLPLYMFLYGLGLGISCALLLPHEQQLEQYLCKVVQIVRKHTAHLIIDY